MAKGFARAGADLAIASRDLDSCEAAAEIEALGRRAAAFACHVAHWEQCERLVDAVYAHFGRVDVLVNNAGMSPIAPSSAETSEALYDKVLGVNLKGPFRLMALRRPAHGRGRGRLDHQHQQHRARSARRRRRRPTPRPRPASTR